MMMALQKNRSTALQHICVHSAYHVYGLIRKSALRLVSHSFCLAIFVGTTDSLGARR